eukprot:SM000024S07843  [mRNA]  locus=s24:787619:790423:- [translate_table: standard]
MAAPQPCRRRRGRLAVAALSLLAWAALASARTTLEADTLPGWMGETHHGQRRKVKRSTSTRRGVSKLGTGIPPAPEKWVLNPRRVIQLSWKPRAFLYKGFLTMEECDHMIQLAIPHLARSTVADNESGKSVLSEIRTSSGMFINKYYDEVILGIEEKIAAWTFLPKENGEAIQVLRYDLGQKYEPHFDYFQDATNAAMGGHRVATVLMYLSNVTKGGETVFPSAEDMINMEKDDSWSECGKKGAAVKPIKGDALLFFSLHPDASPDEWSLHTGCPVVQGEKYSATKWIHVNSFDPKPRPDPNKCTDEEARCGEWAAMGECTKNPEFMVGSVEFGGACRKSCRACKKNTAS